MNTKPKLHLVGLNAGMTAEHLLLLYEQTTGKTRTAQDIADVQAAFAEAGLDPQTGRTK